MKRALVCLSLLLGSLGAMAQTGVVQGHCYVGGIKATTSGQPSSNYLDGIIPACTVTVFLTGSNTKATITTPTGGTQPNPFAANAVPAVDPGGWIFAAAVNQGLDVVMSGGNNNPNCNTAPLCYTSPVTLVDVFPSQSFTPVAGVTSISSLSPVQVNGGVGPVTGNVTISCPSCLTSPLAVQVNDSTSGVNQAVIDFNSTSPAAPGGNTNVVWQNDTVTGRKSAYFPTMVFKLNGSTSGVSQTTIDFNSTAPAAPSGNNNCTWQNDTSTGEKSCYIPNSSAGMAVNYAPPAGGQFFFLRPSACGYSATGSNPSGSGSCSPDNSGGGQNGTNIGPANQTNSELTFTFTLPSFIVQGNITSVYVGATYFFGGAGTISLVSANCSDGGLGIVNFASTGSADQILQQSVTIFPHIPTINSVTCTYAVSGSAGYSGGGGYLNAAVGLGMFIFYTGTAPPATPAVINVYPPLYYQNGTLTFASPFDVAYDNTNTNSYISTVPAYSTPGSQLFPGSTVILVAANGSTSTTPTLNLNGLGAVTIQKAGSALASGDIVAGRPAMLLFDGSHYQLQNPTAAASGVASVSNTDGSLTISPTSGAVIAGINIAHTNSFSATQNFTNATLGLDCSTAGQCKLPVATGYSSAANGECGFDQTNNNWHCWNGADRLMVPLANGFTSGHCGQPTSTGGKWEIVDTGGACGSGSGTVSDGGGTTTANQIAVSTSSGHVIGYKDFPEHLIVPAANCNSSTAGAGWSIPASNNPTVACRAGTNNLGGVLQWANNNTTMNAQFTIQLPFDWDTSVQPWINIIYGSGANTSGTVKWTFSTACTKSDGSVTDDPSFNAESATAGHTMATANRMWAESVQFTAVTSGNNCIQGSPMIVKITSGNGTATSTVNVEEVTITIPRQIVDQAN